MMGGASGHGSSSSSNVLTCTGCKNSTVSGIIKGTFVPDGSNHGKSIYRKEGPSNTTVLIYFWDDRDGPSFSGWWFGPKVGGDQVWAYNEYKASPVPPQAGWKVPWDGPVDESLRLSPAPGGGHGSSRSDGRIPPPQSLRREEDDDRRRREGDRRDAPREPPRDYQREQQRREDERRRRDEEERRKREKEEQEAKRAADAKRRREEDEARRREQNAALAVRKAIQRLRMATPDTYDTVRADLESVQMKHMEDMGTQAEKVAKECEQALEQAQERIDEIKRKEEEDERKRLEEEQRQKEEKELVDKVLEEVRGEAETAEQLLSAAEEAGQGIPEGVDALPEVIVSAAEACVKSLEAAQASIDSVVKSIDDKWEQVKRTHLRDTAGPQMTKYKRRLQDGERSLGKLSKTAKAARDRATRKSAAMKKFAVRKERFSKADADGDGKLNLDEVCAFASSEYDCELPEECKQLIMRVLEPITFDKFQRVRGMVAIAKSEIQAREKRAEEEERKRIVAERKAKIQQILDEAQGVLTAAESATSRGEEAAVPLNKSEDVSKESIQETIQTIDSLLKEAQENLDATEQKMQKAEDECTGNESLIEHTARETPPLKAQKSRIEGRMDQLRQQIKVAEEKVVEKAYAELEGHRSRAVTAMRAYMNAEKKTGEQLFSEVAGGGSTLDKEKWQKFLLGLPEVNLSEEEASQVFDHVAGSGNSDINQEKFVDLLRFFFKCVTKTVLTEDVGIKSKTIRKLEVGEFLEALEGPTKDEAASVMRYRCQCVNDKATGWVTFAGNQGTSFLEPGGQTMTCVKETIVTDGLSVQDSKTLRRVAIDEKVDVIEHQKDEKSDVPRIKGKLKLDGLTGWVSVAGNQGATFLTPC